MKEMKISVGAFRRAPSEGAVGRVPVIDEAHEQQDVHCHR